MLMPAIIAVFGMFRVSVIHNHNYKAIGKCAKTALKHIDIVNKEYICGGIGDDKYDSIVEYIDSVYKLVENYDKQLIKIHLWTYNSLYKNFEKKLEAYDQYLTELEKEFSEEETA